MRKSYLFSIIIILIILIISLLPLVDGYIFKIHYLKFLTSLEQSKGGMFKVNVQEYRLGWLHSDVKLTLASTRNNSQSATFVINNQITHGPFVYDSANKHYTFALAAVTGDTYLPIDLQQKLQSGANVAFIQSRGVVSFKNKWTQIVTVPSFTIQDIGTVTIQDSVTNTIFSINGGKINKINVTGNVGSVNFVADAKSDLPSMSAAPIIINQELDLQQDGWWNSNGTMNIANVSLKSRDGKQASLNNIELTVQKGINANNLFDNKMHMTVESINSPDQSLAISSLRFDVAVANLDPSGLQQFDNYHGSLQHNAAADLGDRQALILNMLTATSTFMLDLNMNTSLGAVALNCNAALKAGTAKPASIDDVMDNAVVNANFRIAAPLLNSMIDRKINAMSMNASLNAAALPPMNSPDVSQKMIDMFVAQGYINKDNNDYVSVIKIENKTATINGKPFSPFMPMPGVMPGMAPGPVMPPMPVAPMQPPVNDNDLDAMPDFSQ